MSSSENFEQPIQMMIDSAALVVEPDETPTPTPTPFEASTGEKRKREGRIRSGVWQHFTRLEKKPGEREECRCNHCGQLYACSSRSGTGHLNRHIFDGRCPKYKPMPLNSQASIAHEREDLDDIFSGMPPKVSPMDTPSDSLNKEDLVQMESQLAPLKRENTKLRKEKDALTAQKESLEQLLVTMAAETARLTEENTKLKEDYAKLQEEKERSVTREEFARLEAQVSKLREEFEKDRRGFPATVATALAQIHKNR